MQIIASEIKKHIDKLQALVGGASKGSTEGHEKIVFTGDRVFAFNGDVFISSPLQTGLFGALQGDVFCKIIGKYGADQIEIETAENELTVKKDRSISKFVFDSAAVCPVDICPAEEDWKKLPDDFTTAINMCSFTCGEDYTDPRTVCIHVRGRMAESSDCSRITRFAMSGKVHDDLYIPVRVLKYLNKSKPVAYNKTEDWVMFRDLDGAIISHRIIVFSDPYPDLAGIINAATDCHELVLPQRLYDSIEKAAVFLADKFQHDRFVSIRCAEGKLRITSNGPTGSYKEILKIDFQESVEFEINPDFFMQMMEKSNTIQVNGDLLKISVQNCTYLTSLVSSKE